MYGTLSSSHNAQIQDLHYIQLNQSTSPFYYVVEKGDTLHSIALKTNQTEEKIKQLNPLIFQLTTKKLNQYKTKLYPGQKIIVDEVNQISLPPPPNLIDEGWGTMHIVRSYDTLKSIAMEYNTTEEAIRADNRQYFPTGERGILFEGQLLLIRTVNNGYYGEYPIQESPVHKKIHQIYPTEQLSQEYNQNDHYLYHRITNNDSFESICSQYNITMEYLLEKNRDKFPIGVRLELKRNDVLIVGKKQQQQQLQRNVAEVILTKQLHIVKYKETPEEIAQMYQMTLDELREYNRAYFPKGYRGEIHPGMKLVVKKQAKSSSNNQYEETKQVHKRKKYRNNQRNDDESDSDEMEDSEQRDQSKKNTTNQMYHEIQ